MFEFPLLSAAGAVGMRSLFAVFCIAALLFATNPTLDDYVPWAMGEVAGSGPAGKHQLEKALFSVFGTPMLRSLRETDEHDCNIINTFRAETLGWKYFYTLNLTTNKKWSWVLTGDLNAQYMFIQHSIFRHLR